MLALQKKYSHFQRIGQRKANETEQQSFPDVLKTVGFEAYVTQTHIRHPERNQQDDDAKQLVKYIFSNHCFICADEIILDKPCNAA